MLVEYGDKVKTFDFEVSFRDVKGFDRHMDGFFEDESRTRKFLSDLEEKI